MVPSDEEKNARPTNKHEKHEDVVLSPTDEKAVADATDEEHWGTCLSLDACAIGTMD